MGDLKPYHRILDIGCSVGRLAMPLRNYLNDKGSYVGLDVVPPVLVPVYVRACFPVGMSNQAYIRVATAHVLMRFVANDAVPGFISYFSLSVCS